ncbi:hypothetical protein J6590_024453 [Homalodisca vitripennis]|nr:hypothetical protein J6590_024453 [Homalodisca vitripennis]
MSLASLWWKESRECSCTAPSTSPYMSPGIARHSMSFIASLSCNIFKGFSAFFRLLSDGRVVTEACCCNTAEGRIFERFEAARRDQGILTLPDDWFLVNIHSIRESPIGRLPRWRIGERSPDMVGTREIKYPGWTKTSNLLPCS